MQFPLDVPILAIAAQEERDSFEENLLTSVGLVDPFRLQHPGPSQSLCFSSSHVMKFDEASFRCIVGSFPRADDLRLAAHLVSICFLSAFQSDSPFSLRQCCTTAEIEPH